MKRQWYSISRYAGGPRSRKKRDMGISAKAFVFNKSGKFLTMRRTKTAPSNPLTWDLPGGDIEYGEEPKKAIVREIKEETGFIPKNLSTIDAVAKIYHGDLYWVTLAYRCEVGKGKLRISWEHDLYKWVTPREFLALDIPQKLKRFALTLQGR
jgi:8-oxo-dGTP diphosphatase